MTGERSVIREVSWRDLLPWLIIFRTFGLAKSAPVLLLGTVGALLTPIGWHLSESLFIDPETVIRDPEFQRAMELNGAWPNHQAAVAVPNDGEIPRTVWGILQTRPDSVHAVFWRLIDPGRRLLAGDLPVPHVAYYCFGFVWMLLVWGFFGGAITRIAAVKLGREEHVGLGEATRHAARDLGSYIASPLFPLLGVALTALPLIGLGFLARFDWGVLVAGIFWILCLLGGLFITIFLLGLLFGWPLMWAVISSERNGDAFEAFSRSYSYTFQRPLHYLFYATVAAFFGGLAWLLVYHFAEAVVWFTEWPVALAAGPNRWGEVHLIRAEPAAGGSLLLLGSLLIGWFNALVRSLATGFGYSFFWCLATAVYLLLRRDVDQTEFDEVFVKDDVEVPASPPAEAPSRPETGAAADAERPTAAESGSSDTAGGAAGDAAPPPGDDKKADD